MQQGSCPYAERCNFAHGEHELQTPISPMAFPGQMNTVDGGGGVPVRAGSWGAVVGGSGRQSNYKTRICQNWQQSGQCTFGSRCNFAHGMHEVRGNGRSGGYRELNQCSQANLENDVVVERLAHDCLSLCMLRPWLLAIFFSLMRILHMECLVPQTRQSRESFMNAECLPSVTP